MFVPFLELATPQQLAVFVKTWSLIKTSLGTSPAFQKVRETSQEKAIINNLRQLASSADQYFIETGEESVAVDELVGPTKYMRELVAIGGEVYPAFITARDKEIAATLPDGSIIAIDF